MFPSNKCTSSYSWNNTIFIINKSNTGSTKVGSIFSVEEIKQDPEGIETISYNWFSIGPTNGESPTIVGTEDTYMVTSEDFFQKDYEYFDE